MLFRSVENLLLPKFNVDLAENGKQAYDLVLQKGSSFYSAIVLDINMPIMDGYEACNKIHAIIEEECLIAHMSIKKKYRSAALSEKMLLENLSER